MIKQKPDGYPKLDRQVFVDSAGTIFDRQIRMERSLIAPQSSATFLANGKSEVALLSTTNEAEIYYSLDAPFQQDKALNITRRKKHALNVGQVLTAIAMKNGMVNSPVITIQAQQKSEITYVLQQISIRVDANNDGVSDRADVCTTY